MASSVVSDNFETSSGAIPNIGGADVTTRNKQDDNYSK